MQSKAVTIINKLGLHARASMRLVDIAHRFGSRIQLHYRNQCIDAKDILAVMTLGAGCGATLTLQAEGEDEQNAISALISLIENRLGESE